jgi:hypothetical protein
VPERSFRKLSTQKYQTNRNWSKLAETGRNWSKTVKTGQNRLKPVKNGKTGQNLSNMVETGPNWSKLVQTGPNWTKPVQTIPNLRFCFLKTAQHRTLFEETLAGTKEEEEVSNSSCESDCFCPFSCVGTDLRPASVLHPSSTASAIISN